jgi:hypothetical protein
LDAEAIAKAAMRFVEVKRQAQSDIQALHRARERLVSERTALINHLRALLLHRNKDVILGEDGYANRSGGAPRNIFSLMGFALKIRKSVSPSPTRAIELFQDDRNKALRLFAG